jgi:dimethylargininase
MIAFTREVSASIGCCELTHVPRVPIDLELVRAQHCAFEEALKLLGCEVRRLPDLPESPDAVFVQDTAIVFDEVAVICRPGAESRRAEIASVADALGEFRPLYLIQPPGTLDGGDVISVDRNVWVGRSGRTNDDGIRQLREQLAWFGYTVRSVPVNGCLHLQSAITPIANSVMLINRRWVNPSAFEQFEFIDIDPSEPFAANALRVGNSVVYATAFPQTRARLESHGIRVVAVDLSELAKAEGGVTCCCILVPIAVAARQAQ